MEVSAVERRGNGSGHGGPARGYSWPPFEKDNTAAMRHGATSERRIGPLARNHKRRVLRQIGLRASEIDPIGKAYLEHYTRLTAKVVLIDRYLDEVGVLDEHGSPRPCMNLYTRLHGAAVQALARLERHLGPRERDPFAALEAHLAEMRAVKDVNAD
jgi:hypothetical protein